MAIIGLCVGWATGFRRTVPAWLWSV